MSKTETQSDVQRYATLLEKYVKGASLPDFQEDMVLEAAAYLRRLDAENKALRADAERYHHLRDCNSGSLVVMQITGTDEDDWHVLTEGDADEAIDTAMAAAKTGDAA